MPPRPVERLKNEFYVSRSPQGFLDITLQDAVAKQWLHSLHSLHSTTDKLQEAKRRAKEAEAQEAFRRTLDRRHH